MKMVPKTYKCPKCNSLINGWMYLSGNTFDSILYSDTYLEAEMDIPFMSSYIGCPKCNTVFKTEESLDVERLYISDSTIPGPLSDFETLKILLEGPRFNDKLSRKKFTLHYLHMYNHELNEEMKKEEIESGDFKKYVDELLQILEEDFLEEKTVDFIILKAEILRELGQFDKAKEAIKRAEEENITNERIKSILNRIKDRIIQKDTSVFVIE